jgi:hypothetical protein
MKLAATILTTLIAIVAAAPPALKPTDVSNPGPTARSVAANESPDVSTSHAYNMIMSFVSLLTQTQRDATLELLVQLKLVTQEQVDSLHIGAYAEVDARAAAPAPAAPTDTGGK